MALTAPTPVLFSNNSTSSGTQATWLGALILLSLLVFERTSANDSRASGKPMRSNLPIITFGSDSPTLKSANRRLDEPLLMVRTDCIDVAFNYRLPSSARRRSAGQTG